MPSFTDSIRRSAFTGFVGMTCTCPHCGSILDRKRARMLTATVDGDIAYCAVHCTDCSPAPTEDRAGNVAAAIARTCPDAKLAELEYETLAGLEAAFHYRLHPGYVELYTPTPVNPNQLTLEV